MALEEEDFHCSYLRCNFTIILFAEALIIAMFSMFSKYDDTS